MNNDDAERIANLTADLMMIIGRMKGSAIHSDRERPHPGTEYAILDTILRYECKTVPEIAAWRGVARQSVQVAVNKMLASGALALVDNPNHKLSKLVEVQPSGLEQYETARSYLRRNYQAVDRRLEDGDLDAAARVLAIIAETWGIDVAVDSLDTVKVPSSHT